MSQRVLLATFREEDDLRGAVRQVRSSGAKILDVYSPYAVHGLDEDLGWRPSRLTWACALCGGAGVLFMVWFQFWASAVSWPLNIGGKPFNSLPAFVPVIFEAMVLCGAFGTVLAFFYIARLRPGKRVQLIRPRVTDDRFALVIEQSDATFDVKQMSSLLEQHHAEQIEERAIVARRSGCDDNEGNCPVLRWVNISLMVVLAAVAMAVLFTPRNPSQLNVEFFPTMRRSIPLEPQTAMGGIPAPRPIPGTIARDARPLDYQATEEDAKRAAEQLQSSLAADDMAAMERGREVYFNFCSACHGSAGDGDGPIPVRGYPPPPPLGAEKSRLLKDGELFHVISYGRNNMPAHRKLLSQEDRWKSLLFIRELQRRAVVKAEQAAKAAAAAAAAAAAKSEGGESPADESAEPATGKGSDQDTAEASAPKPSAQPDEAPVAETKPKPAEEANADSETEEETE